MYTHIYTYIYPEAYVITFSIGSNTPDLATIGYVAQLG